MIIWLILLCLIIIDINLGIKFVVLRSRDRSVGTLFCLFFINYIPLKLFEVYHNDISLYLKYFGLELFEDINFLGILRSLWNLFLNFLQYSSSLYLYGFWFSGFISLALAYDNSQPAKACWSFFFGIINPLFFFLYNNSAGEKEYFIMLGITIFIYAISLIKFNKHYFDDYRIRKIMCRYFFIIVITILIQLKQLFFAELDIFDISLIWISFCLPILISYTILFYYACSIVGIYDILSVAWVEFKDKNRKYFQIEANMWKICKFYLLNLFFMFSMYFLYDLIAALWGEIWILKEIMFYILSWVVGYNLICLEDWDNYNADQVGLNSFSVYFQIWAAKIILRNIL